LNLSRSAIKLMVGYNFAIGDDSPNRISFLWMVAGIRKYPIAECHN